MPSGTYTTEEIVNYLLGAMSEAEADNFEQAYFGDSALSLTVTEIENDLIDDYVRGQLPLHQCKRFERHYLPHPNRRRRVEDAKVLLFKLDQLKKELPAGPEKGYWRQLLHASMPGRVFPYAWAPFVILLALGGFLLWRQSGQPREQITAPQVTRTDSAQRSLDIAQQAATEHQSKPQSAGGVEQSRPRPSVSPAQANAPSKVPALTLTIGAMRGVRSEGINQEPSPKLQKITSGDKEIRLILKMRETDFRTYRAEIWANGEKIFSTSDNVTFKRQAGVETVTVNAPTDLFKKGLSSYRVQLIGTAPTGQEQSVGPAFFRIEKR